MQKADIEFAFRLTSHEKWSDIKSDFLALISYSNETAFIMENKDKKIGMISAIDYGDFGFIGSLIIHPDFRGKGYGTTLLEFGVEKLQKEGARLVMLDAVQEAIPIYEKLGFKTLYKSHRFRGTIHIETNPRVRNMKSADLSEVFEMDEHCFGVDRSHFLESLFTHHSSYARVLRSDEDGLEGYAFASMREEYCRVGPVVLANPNHSEVLIRSVPIDDSLAIRIGALGYNGNALSLFRKLGLWEEVGSFRMGLGDPDASPQQICQYAIGSPAKG